MRWRVLLSVALTPCLVFGESPVRIGERGIAMAELDRALEQCHANAPEIAPEVCLQSYWVPLWLLDREAARLKLRQTPAFAEARAEILSRSLIDSIEAKTPPPSTKAVTAYLEEHSRDFTRPQRIRVFRILVPTKEQATRLIEQLGKAPTLAQFRELAREHSVDKATHERGGDLGYVWPDGTTDVPQVRTVPRIYDAVADLAEGEVSQEPVREADFFAVLLHRGTLPARAIAEDEARALASHRLREQAAGQRLRELLARLQKQAPVVVHADMLNRFKRPENKLFER